MASLVTVTGDKEVERALKRLIGPELLRVVKSASNKAMTPVRATARKLVAVDTGTTKKAIIKKQVTYKREGNILTIVGVRRATLKTASSGQAASNLEHLLEFGHLIVRNGKVFGFVRPKPFLAPALSRNRSKIQSIYARELEKGIHREAKKGGFKA